jgi:hypothetical protein
MSGRTLDGRHVNDRRLLRVFVGGRDADAAFNAAPPPGFPVAGTSDDGGSGRPLPIWGWALIGGAGLVVVVVVIVARHLLEMLLRNPGKLCARAVPVFGFDG